MAVAIPILMLVGAEVAGVAVTGAMIAGAVVATAGAAMDNKDVALAGSVISLGSGLLSGAATAGAEAGTSATVADAAAPTTTEAMTTSTLSGKDPTAATGLATAPTNEGVQTFGVSAKDQVAQSPLPGGVDAAQPATVADSVGSQPLAEQSLAGKGMIDSQIPAELSGGAPAGSDAAQWQDRLGDYNTGQFQGPPSTAAGKPSGGLIDGLMEWGKGNPLLASTALNMGGRFVEKGFTKDPNQERLKYLREKDAMELELLQQKLARQNNIPGIPFRLNQQTNLYPGGQMNMPRVGMINSQG